MKKPMRFKKPRRRTLRSDEALELKWRAFLSFTTEEDLMDAYAAMHFRERQRVKMLASQRGISIEEMVAVMASAGLRRMGPRRLEEKYGTAGLRRPAGADIWRLIDLRLARIGWTRERLGEFL